MKMKHSKLIGCDFCKYRNSCQEKIYHTPKGCEHFCKDNDMNEYNLVVCLKVNVVASNEEEAIKQVLFDRYNNSNPSVVITEEKYIGDFEINK